MTTEADVTRLASTNLRSELQRLEKQRDRLLKAFPHLGESPRVASIIAQYDVGTPPELRDLWELRRGITSLKRELLKRGEEVQTAESEGVMPPRKKRGRPPENERTYEFICEQYKKNKMLLKPKELSELPALKGVLDTVTNPPNFVSKALIWGREHGIL